MKDAKEERTAGTCGARKIKRGRESLEERTGGFRREESEAHFVR